jgi:hypothetical protein
MAVGRPRRRTRRVRAPLTVEDLHQAMTGGGLHTIDPARRLYARIGGRLYPVVAVSVGVALGHAALILDAADIPGEAGADKPGADR